MFGDTHTIAAVSTPAGAAARGIVRLSGDDAFDIAAARLEPSVDLRAVEPYSCINAVFRLAARPVMLPVTLYVMPAPRSYTREDVLEIHTISSPVIQEMLMNELVALGARPAEPGEFTRRAFLNGRIDLSQAEAVIDVIHARTASELRVAVAQLTGSASKSLSGLRDHLIGLRAYVEASIDFSDQDIELISLDDITASLTEARGMIAELVGSARRSASGKPGVATALIGLPNAGKSSLLNRLAGADHAVVTHVPGTTRDTVEAVISIDGTAFRLIDTAGIEDAADHIGRSAVERSREALASAQLLLHVVDGSRGRLRGDAELSRSHTDVPCIVVVNKADRPQPLAAADVAAELGADHVVALSAVRGTGIAELKAAMARCVASGEVDASGHSFTSSVRRREALLRADERLSAALELSAQDAGAEFIALEVREALDHLARFGGDVADDDILDAIFSRFCIGK